MYLKTAILLIMTAAASWSKPRAICWILVESTQFLAHVVTLTLRWPLECWYCVINCMHPRPPWGTGAVCWDKSQVKDVQAIYNNNNNNNNNDNDEKNKQTNKQNFNVWLSGRLTWLPLKMLLGVFWEWRRKFRIWNRFYGIQNYNLPHYSATLDYKTGRQVFLPQNLFFKGILNLTCEQTHLGSREAGVQGMQSATESLLAG